jgi:hypothetical protein
MAEPVKLDFSKAAPVGEDGEVKLDFSKAVPVNDLSPENLAKNKELNDPKKPTQFEQDRSWWNRATGRAAPPAEAGSAAQVVKSAGNIVGRGLEGVGGMIAHPIETAKGAIPQIHELFNPTTDVNGPMHQRVQQFIEEYQRNPAEAVENASGDILSMYLAGKLTKATGKVGGKVVDAMKNVKGPKAGVSMPTVAKEYVKDANTKAATHLEQTQDALYETQGRELKHELAVKATDAENTKMAQQHAQNVQSVEEANAAKTKEYEAAKAHAEQIAKHAQETETQRGKLARQVKEQSARMVERVKRVKEQTKAKLDAAYDEIRQKTAGASVPRENLAASVTKAESLLKGSSESIKIFRDIISKAPEEAPDSIKYQGGNIPKGHPLYDVLREMQGDGQSVEPADFSQLQGYYSELGDKLAPGNLPSDVYLALRSLQTDIAGMMDKLATEKGVGGKLRTTQAMYRDYMQTFRESAGPNHSGSPLSQVLDAKDPDYAIKPLTEESTAQRIRNMLARFDQTESGAGGAAPLYDNFRNVSRQYEGVSKPVKVPEVPKPPVLAETPAQPEPKYAPEPPERVNHPDRPTEPSAEGLAEAKRNKVSSVADDLRRYALRRSFYSLALAIPLALKAVLATGDFITAGEEVVGAPVVTYWAMDKMANLLEKPGVKDWLSKPTPKDLEFLRRLPEDQKAMAAKNFSPVVKAAAQKGVQVSPAILQALGAGMAANTAPKKKIAEFLK